MKMEECKPAIKVLSALTNTDSNKSISTQLNVRQQSNFPIRTSSMFVK